jgi:predicted oxidoreductase
LKRIDTLHSDITFSELAYGVWRLAESQPTTSSTEAKIQACLDQGITTFDHADIYGDYQCEQLFGDALKANPSLRSQMELVSKCDIALISEKYPQRRVKYYDTSRKYIFQQVEQSLKHLNSDYLDTLLIHRPDPLMDVEETGAALDDLIKQGLVRTVGVSNFSVWQWKLLQSKMTNRLITNQIEINLFEQSSLWDGTLEAMQFDQLLPMAWSPLAGGQLFNQALNPELESVLKRIEQNQRCQREHIALAWLRMHPANILPVVGTNNQARIKALHQFNNVELDRETWFELLTAAKGSEVP